MNKSPAFQFYPDKWQSHTRRLSDSSYRVYHELLCWMWQSSKDYCSIEASADAVACAVAMPIECVRIAVAEILNAFAPLLKEENGRWVSNGLRKEAEKQNRMRTQCRRNAESRWKDAVASKNDAVASIPQCFPSPSPSPTLVSKGRFEKPSREQLDLQAAKIGLSPVEVDKFVNFYESNGWKVGKNPMKSWTHALSNWKLNGYGKNTNSSKPNPRNAGVATGGTNYAEAGKRKMELDSLKTQHLIASNAKAT